MPTNTLDLGSHPRPSRNKHLRGSANLEHDSPQSLRRWNVLTITLGCSIYKSLVEHPRSSRKTLNRSSHHIRESLTQLPQGSVLR
ncbi:hypothetical protein CTAM01_04076 [Colletotrichum tamarilloi]|uniref:Uncharacterized protein n=1 Tax=Colletotrichum tamarilloi TaxID=1209934 RepID=A0ABQ9RJE8_9PEZI|nr:uncharacterized protein CTAM01_04076 [Colletotrichum tamarilloi]KAK1504769.1 hypothetical protein CTAM01_04076 [Colletotrichum tamarilloi]